MKSHLWKLALLAGVIWLGIYLQHNTNRIPDKPEDAPAASITPSPAASATVPASSPEKGALETKSTEQSPTQASGPTAATTPSPVPVYHAVQAGEVPGIIAAHYGISVDQLLQLNQITDPTLVQIGQKLLIPVTPTPAQPAGPTPPPTPTPQLYTVQPGDTLLAIALAFSTSVEAIMIASHVDNPHTLQIAQELVIPPNRGSILGVPTTIHQIQSGDTLLSVAAKYGSTVDDILVTNPDLEPERLQIGQKLIVPLTQPRNNPAGKPLHPRITTPVDPLPGMSALEQQTLNAVNLERQRQGLSPLTPGPLLTTSARAHSQDMISRGYFSHVTPEGLTLRDRLADLGLKYTYTGENIQRNVQPQANTVAYAINWFMDSRPHRNNILHNHYTRLGVGVAEGPAGWYTFVLVFAE